MSASAISPSAASLQIARSLDDGWDYRPNWRSQQIDEYLTQIAVEKDRADALQAILWREPDPYVRQGLRIRFAGNCVHEAAIAWAFRAAHDNGTSGIGSRIKALVIADRFPEEIEQLLRIPVARIIAFEKLFWDVRRFLNSDLWLETLGQAAEERSPKTTGGVREAIWLRTALHEGWEGLERLWFRKRGTDAKSLEELSREIEGIAARRSLRRMQALEERGEPVSDDDIKRLAILSRRSASSADAAGQNADIRGFYGRLFDMGIRNVIAQEPESPKVKALDMVFADRLGVGKLATMPVQRRMRALSAG
jgi:hypothetical protein